ncbi:hypothetical protein MSPP1_002740 [Malassezia sp. CBS 17886]|nr:hypothetical protein MSPP1_002740 [Malassezia sp. CBS 17886]
MTSIMLPHGAAYTGATAELLEAARKDEGAVYLPSVFNPATATQKGVLRVAEDRVPAKRTTDKKPGYNVYYELHGKGPKHIVFLMGVNNSCFGWLGQVEEFGRDPEYSVLVLDNCGYGNSDAPFVRLKTTDFALDTRELLDHVGWTEKQSVHVVGVSMGGMIALELGALCTDRIASLTLLSTTPGEMHNLPPLAGLQMFSLSLAESIVGASPHRRVYRIIEVLFPPEWLEQKHVSDPRGRTNREVIREAFLWRYEFVRKPQLQGAMSQLMACLTHHVPREELVRMQDTIPDVKIIVGDWDQLVNTKHSAYMHEVMPKADYQVWKGGGHALHYQFQDRFNKMLRDMTS